MTDDELIARLEAAPEGSRELDEDIAGLVRGIRFDGEAWVNRHNVECNKPLLYTSSLDAALTLVPEGAHWVLNVPKRDLALGRIFVDDSEWGEESQAATPPLALCIAALKARKG